MNWRAMHPIAHTSFLSLLCGSLEASISGEK
jgi:hypothetical protein